ncbi:MAG: WxL protein peptidoglycan domain-containing protein [Acidimicrobiia bacterium]
MTLISNGLRAVLAAVLCCMALGAIAAPSVAQTTPQQPSTAVTWGVIPSSADGPTGRTAFEYLLDPGESVTDWLGVSNYGYQDLELEIYATDAFTTPEGGFDLLAANRPPSDVGSWVEFGVETIVVPARSRTDLPFRLTVPPNATPGDHVGGAIAAYVTETDGAEGTVRLDRRIASRIYLRVAGDLNPQLAIESLRADFTDTLVPFGPGTLSLSYTVTNTGNVRMSGPTTLTISGPLGIGLRPVEVGALPDLLPGNSLDFVTVIDDVAPLIFLDLTLRIDPSAPGLGNVESVAATTQVWAISAVGFGLVAVLLVAALWFWWSRRRQRLADRRAETEEE